MKWPKANADKMVVDYLHNGFWTHGSVLSSWQGNMCKPTFKRKKRKTGCWIWKQKKFSKKGVKVSAVCFHFLKLLDIQTDRNCIQLQKYQESIRKVSSICQPNVSGQSVWDTAKNAMCWLCAGKGIQKQGFRHVHDPLGTRCPRRGQVMPEIRSLIRAMEKTEALCFNDFSWPLSALFVSRVDSVNIYL